MKHIYRNRHPAGRLWNLVFGLASLADGAVRVSSLGFLHTDLTVVVARNQARAMLQRAKKINHANQTT